MENRYLHMLSWGLLYSVFSSVVVTLYKYMFAREKVICFTVQNRRKVVVSYADLVIYLVITTISAIRLNTGSDFYNYYIYFNQVRERYSSIREILLQSQSGYWILSYLVKMFTDYEYAIFVVIAVLSYAYLFRLIRNEVDDLPCALTCYFFLGFYAYSNNMLKQYIAMAFVMSAHLNYNKKKFLKCAFCCLGAFCFHYSAGLVLALMILIRNIKVSMSRYRLSIILGVVGAVTLNYIFVIFFRLIPSASGYEKYINWRRTGQFRLVAAVAGMSLIYAILIYVITKHKDKIKMVSEQRYREIIFLIAGLCINILSIRQWIIFRIATYFYQFIILILPTMFVGMDYHMKKKLKIFLYSVMFLYMIFSSVFLGENEYFSYNTVFSGAKPMSDVQYNIMHGWSK